MKSHRLPLRDGCDVNFGPSNGGHRSAVNGRRASAGDRPLDGRVMQRRCPHTWGTRRARSRPRAQTCHTHVDAREVPGAPRGEPLAAALVGPAVAALRASPERHPAVDEVSDAAGYALVVDYRVRAAGNFLHVDGAVSEGGAAEPRARFEVRSRL